jgi:hypothetical protein
MHATNGTRRSASEDTGFAAFILSVFPAIRKDAEFATPALTGIHPIADFLMKRHQGKTCKIVGQIFTKFVLCTFEKHKMACRIVGSVSVPPV